MAFTQEEIKKYSKKIEDYIEKIRPEENLRSKVDIRYKIERQSHYCPVNFQRVANN